MSKLITEIWKNIPYYEELYKASTFGRIKSLIRKNRLKEIFLKQTKDRDGYFYVSLCKNGISKNHKVHRLVLETFVGFCPKGFEGCHNDGDPSNNFIGNLRWDTRKNNANDSIKHKTFLGNSKLSIEEVIEIKKLLKENILTVKEIAKRYNVSKQVIYEIKENRTWKKIFI